MFNIISKKGKPMSQNRQHFGSNLAKVDSYIISLKEYEELPELKESDLERAVWKIASQEVTAIEGRAAFHSQLNK
jgi:hypothetical protein